jgi:hypothetical protein
MNANTVKRMKAKYIKRIEMTSGQVILRVRKEVVPTLKQLRASD